MGGLAALVGGLRIREAACNVCTAGGAGVRMGDCGLSRGVSTRSGVAKRAGRSESEGQSNGVWWRAGAPALQLPSLVQVCCLRCSQLHFCSLSLRLSARHLPMQIGSQFAEVSLRRLQNCLRFYLRYFQLSPPFIQLRPLHNSCCFHSRQPALGCSNCSMLSLLGSGERTRHGRL